MLKFEIYQKNVFPYGQSGYALVDTYEVDYNDAEGLNKVRSFHVQSNYFVQPMNAKSQVALIEPDVLVDNDEVERLKGVVERLENRCVDLVDEVEDLKMDLEEVQTEKEDLEMELSYAETNGQDALVEYLCQTTDENFHRFVGEITVKRAKS